MNNIKGAREAALYALNRVLDTGAYSNIVLSEAFSQGNITSEDKGLCTDIFYGTLKYKYTIDIILSNYIKKDIKKVQRDLFNILRISIYQIKYLDKVPDYAVVNEAVNLAKKYCGRGAGAFANGVIRNYLRNGEGFTEKINDDILKLAYTYSMPPFLIKMLIKQYKEKVAIDILKGLNSTPDLTCRINTLKTDIPKAIEALKALGYEVKEGTLSPYAVHIRHGSMILDNELFKEGIIFPQDESAMMVAPIMELAESINVLDLCSAPGGKTTHIAELMKNKGKITACDIYKHKLSLIKDNCNRLGIDIVDLVMQDATVFNEEFVDRFQRVLIDVPCSGLGIIRKKPEIKWNKSIKEIKDIVVIQRKILDKAAKYVQKNGIMIYSTCTINKEENENNIKWFIENNHNFKLEKINVIDHPNIINSNNTLTILPGEENDGFFIAKLRRIS